MSTVETIGTDPETLKHQEIQKAIEFAVQKHSGKSRKHSGLPYIVHPMAVLSQLGDWGIQDHEVWKAAVCHDILEDCPVTLAELEAIIGQKAASYVHQLSFIPDVAGPEATLQKKAYMKSFKSKSVQALVIKVADRCCNTADFLSYTPDYAVKYWRKADDLMEAFISRHAEIINAFGQSVFPRMRYTRTTLNQIMLHSPR